MNKPSLKFQDVCVSRLDLARAALDLRGLRYEAGVTDAWERDGQWHGHTNCYGLLLLAAKRKGLLAEDFDLNLSPARFGQRQAKTLWEIIHLNFTEADFLDHREYNISDVLLLRYGDVSARNREPHHVAMCVPPPHSYRERCPWMLHAVDTGRIDYCPIDALMRTRIESTWRLNNLKDG